MLEQNKLFIDKDCPLCSIYGKGFTKMGLIDAQTLCYYQAIEPVYAQAIDLHRAKDEIALHDTDTKETVYGIQAFIKILGHNSLLFRYFFKIPLVEILLLRLYRFISYNRKVIYPVAPSIGGADCTPTFSLKYRWLYIGATALFTGLVLHQFIFHINEAFELTQHWSREYIVCIGQVAWQWIAIRLISPKNQWTYLGNMSTVSLIGALLLISVLMFNSFFHLSPWVLLLTFASVVGVMFLEHIRRCKLLDIPLTMTATWVLYCITVLAIILFSTGLIFI